MAFGRGEFSYLGEYRVCRLAFYCTSNTTSYEQKYLVQNPGRFTLSSGQTQLSLALQWCDPISELKEGQGNFQFLSNLVQATPKLHFSNM